jgi:hypothetical protein
MERRASVSGIYDVRGIRGRMMGSGSLRRAIALLALSVIPAAGARAELIFGAWSGPYGLRANQPHEAGFQVEFRLPWQWTVLRPTTGTLIGTGGSAYVFAGVVAELPLVAGLQLNPSFAPGVVLASGERDLGSPIEFRSSIELSAKIFSPLRLALSLSHLSNGGLTHHNPGVEIVMLGLEVQTL